MESYTLEWLQLIFRCLHIVTAIAWIGASFYFVWLDNHLRRPTAKDLQDKGVDGELWAVHGGGFYNPQKYMVAPQTLPKDLHWFYWESYSTWLSGFGLLVLVYFYNAKAMMVDPEVMDITGSQAIGLTLVFFVAAWLIYDGICRVFAKFESVVGILTALLICLVSFATSHVFSGRAAFLVTGAAIATIMTANVLFVIIPGQRRVIELMRSGDVVDPRYGKRGKQRSVHNTYFTLPVLFAMLSGHFSFISLHPDRWLLLVAMMFVGFLVRQFFVLRHFGKNSWSLLAGASLVLLLVFLRLAPVDASQSSTSATATLDDVSAIIERRCVQCHSDNPTLADAPQKNVNFSRAGEIEAHASNIYLQVVQQKIMPIGNITKITDGERDTIKRWFESK
jgi:uncharacterized membrane protein